MADTRPNIDIPRGVPVDIYAATTTHPQGAIPVGSPISVQMIHNGAGFLFSGVTLSGRPDDTTGYQPIDPNETYTNEEGDSGAWIWSDQGCTINVRES